MYFKESQTYVCSMLHLVELGGFTVTSAGTLSGQSANHDDADSDIDYDPEYVGLPYSKFIEHLQKLCHSWDEQVRAKSTNGVNWGSWITKYVPKMAFIEAVTASPGQEYVEDYLGRLGMIPVGPFGKLKHPETKLTVWTMSGAQFCEAIGYVSKYDPRSAEERISHAKGTFACAA